MVVWEVPDTQVNLAQTLDCGQSFRWVQLDDDLFEGVVQGHLCKIGRRGEQLLLEGPTPQEARTLWWRYFALDLDYDRLKAAFCQDPVLSRAVAYAPGIRVLRQDPWEALCTFILSQNNNIPRIKGLVRRLCQSFGRPIQGDWFTFPTPQELQGCTREDMAPLRSGFRARYLVDAVQKVNSNQVDLQTLFSAPLPQARAQLQQICGVGPKVADCTLLYGLQRWACVPMDVWMKRVWANLYPNGFPAALSPWAGIAQQYLFHYARTCPGVLEPVPTAHSSREPVLEG